MIYITNNVNVFQAQKAESVTFFLPIQSNILSGPFKNILTLNLSHLLPVLISVAKFIHRDKLALSSETFTDTALHSSRYPHHTFYVPSGPH